MGKRGPKPYSKRTPWTREEESRLRANWRIVGFRALRGLFRGRSPGAVYQHAWKVMKLPLGQPPGTLGLRPLGKMLGYSVRYLTKILHWAHVKVFSYNMLSHRVRSLYAIDIDDAREATLRWENQAETLEHASLRLHVNEGRLARLMVAAKLRPPRPPGSSRSPLWKNMPEEYDAVVAADRSRCRIGPDHETIRQAAARLRRSQTTLMKALRLLKNPPKLRTPEFYDRMLGAYLLHLQLSRSKSRAARSKA